MVNASAAVGVEQCSNLASILASFTGIPPCQHMCPSCFLASLIYLSSSQHQAEVPSQDKMRLAGTKGFMPYKSAAELIKHSMVG